MDTQIPRPLRTATATATATGSALAVVLLPLVVGALVARSAGGDPMASVNALIAGGGQRGRLSRTHLRGCGGRALATARGTWAHSALRRGGKGPRCLAAALPVAPRASLTRRPIPLRSIPLRSN
ncbi:hypothetical protein ACFQLX_15165 [Streptomyces polyrhachis]|uniref:Uncharacterized protein n=1 Tax=Streptomyces polyrhachis TaxID=1282885 RepID=A0ABW2GFK8_9ACTN